MYIIQQKQTQSQSRERRTAERKRKIDAKEQAHQRLEKDHQIMRKTVHFSTKPKIQSKCGEADQLTFIHSVSAHHNIHPLHDSNHIRPKRISTDKHCDFPTVHHSHKSHPPFTQMTRQQLLAQVYSYLCQITPLTFHAILPFVLHHLIQVHKSVRLQKESHHKKAPHHIPFHCVHSKRRQTPMEEILHCN